MSDSSTEIGGNDSAPAPMGPALTERQRVEVEFWKNDPEERPGVDSLRVQIDKSADALVLHEALTRLGLPEPGVAAVLELGGGQAWGSCVVKRMCPQAHVTATDISPYAIESRGRWERVYDVTVDEAFACPSTQLPVEDESVDFVFCFAAAHHFVEHRETLAELRRVLRPSGVAAYLYEPTAPRWLYKAAYRRVNAKRPDVPEDVLVPAEMSRLADEAGLSCEVDFWPTTLKRGRNAGLYYTALSVVPFLERLLPCTANFVFRRRPAR